MKIFPAMRMIFDDRFLMEIPRRMTTKFGMRLTSSGIDIQMYWWSI